jgi:hypothetical protein
MIEAAENDCSRMIEAVENECKKDDQSGGAKQSMRRSG